MVNNSCFIPLNSAAYRTLGMVENTDLENDGPNSRTGKVTEPDNNCGVG